ncbi:hypothetical protein CEXT_93251 [Caerostris extrusa]|uniref:Uncharacterized protein n=1 Tax=Caerostris extrusa TaxID=172846 RepID=A0AAV4N1M6_CAEEX|nr:hypothetical protein CEXT_93251 [Caerostris extrusa]
MQVLATNSLEPQIFSHLTWNLLLYIHILPLQVLNMDVRCTKVGIRFLLLKSKKEHVLSMDLFYPLHQQDDFDLALLVKLRSNYLVTPNYLLNVNLKGDLCQRKRQNRLSKTRNISFFQSIFYTFQVHAPGLEGVWGDELPSDTGEKGRDCYDL